MDTIKCHKCGTEIEIDKALEMQIESRMISELSERHQKELELESEKAKLKAQREAEKRAQKQDLLIEQLREDAQAAKELNQELRQELKEMNKTLREERKSKENAELAAAKKMHEELERIGQEARKEADESHRLKEEELQKQLMDTKKALDEAKRKAEQGSEQMQGEILELELETLLASEFPMDKVEEVKKGQRGADIRQYVRNNRMEECGFLLWESKNARWSKTWIAKIKDDVREGKASMGILVSREIPEEYGDMMNIEGSIWVVKPKLVRALAAALRSGLIQVHAAYRNSENKGEKMEVLYQFLTGVEFRNRIEAIVDNYNTLLQEIEKEKRAAQLRWGRQEKALRLVIDNTYGLYGDLQGITGSELKIPLLDEEEEE